MLRKVNNLSFRILDIEQEINKEKEQEDKEDEKFKENDDDFDNF